MAPQTVDSRFISLPSASIGIVACQAHIVAQKLKLFLIRDFGPTCLEKGRLDGYNELSMLPFLLRQLIN